MAELIKYIIENPEKGAVIIAAISTLLAVISLLITLASSWRAHKQYLASIEPQLSMRLLEHDGLLYLTIQNTGATVAKDLLIQVKKIKDNGSEDELDLSELFERKFELYPNEMVQGQIARSGKHIACYPWPQVELEITYHKITSKKPESYLRTVIYSEDYINNVNANVKIDKRVIEQDLKCMTIAVLRVANYFDGVKLSYIDELDIIGKNSFKNDIADIFNSEAKEHIKSRRESIGEALEDRKK